ncbi:MAG: preprotein translocase subunit YajC [Bacteroidetes bacterium]|nr:preprotein translocase subunit YajC [Bacteroidota bacterium]
MNTLSILLQAAPGPQSSMPTIIMMVLLFVVFYFFMIRPQQKKAKDARKFRESLQKGTRVVTIGGIHGKVAEVNDKTVLLDVADGVKIRFEKSAVAMDNTMQLTEETAKTA